MRKQPEKTLATKNRITDAFFSIYETTPINKIRIADITETAKCNRSTFYEYFQDIYAVLEYGEQRIIDSVCSNAKEELSHSRQEMLRSIANVYMNNGRTMCILLGENGDPKFFSLFKNALYNEFLDKQKLKDNPEVELVYEYSLTGLIMAFRWWYMNQDSCGIDEFILTMQSLIKNGTLYTLNNVPNINITGEH